MVQPGHVYCPICGAQYYEPGDHDCIANLQSEIEDAKAERLQVEIEAWRSGRLFIGGYRRHPLGSHNVAPWYYTRKNSETNLVSDPHDTIDEAVDALLSEIDGAAEE